MRHTFVGFGFGPIQSGLFAKEAAESGRFDEIVVAEVDGGLVDALRQNNDTYAVNVAHADRVEAVTVKGVRLLNLSVPDDVGHLRAALAAATEIVTSLPSVAFYTRGGEASVAALIAEGLRANTGGQTVVYTAENNNHAAAILREAVVGQDARPGPTRPTQYLNTVIGKMSQVVADPLEIARRNLRPIVPMEGGGAGETAASGGRAFLVEAFNRILVSEITLPGFEPGIMAFEQKADLLPFEEAKLYGHNAIHTVLGFLGKRLGVVSLAELRGHADMMALARQAFVEEIGAALVRKYSRLNDPLFTREGFTAYADDLLERITNPFLADTVGRAIRDPLRKLGANDRIFGAIRQCLAQGIEPSALAHAARVALGVLPQLPEWPAHGVPSDLDATLALLWERDTLAAAEMAQVLPLLAEHR
ncbi:MAG: hypothetical protein FWH21_08360 [Kiritimatiellaeota bacterium]|nr:hypothetical protein [Kiritimatiellota bacterium]